LITVMLFKYITAYCEVLSYQSEADECRRELNGKQGSTLG